LHQGSRRHRTELPGAHSRERLRHRQAPNDDDDRPLCSRLRPDVRDRRQTDVRQQHHLMSLPIRGGGIIRHSIAKPRYDSRNAI